MMFIHIFYLYISFYSLAKSKLIFTVVCVVNSSERQNLSVALDIITYSVSMKHSCYTDNGK